VDELSIKPGIQYDHSLLACIGRPTMRLSGDQDNSNELATHALAFMLAGVTKRWKQVVAYEFTGNSFSANEFHDKVASILKKCTEIGLTVKVFISDMGGQNRALWRLWNINATKHGNVINFCANPSNEHEKLFVMPDPVHVFKNIASSLRSGHNFYLDQSIVEKYNLPSNVVCMTPIIKTFELDQSDVLKLCPHLKKNVLQPSHFEKMNVSLSVRLLSHDVAAAILFHISRNNIDRSHGTTAWFLKIMQKWFKIMTARHYKFGLSHHNDDEWQDTINFLNSFMDITKKLNVGAWKPFQTGLMLATQTALDFQQEYLQNYNFKYVLLGRLTQDALENLFSVVRRRRAVPDARDFKGALRLITLAQFDTQIRHRSYPQSDSEYLIRYCKSIKNTAENLAEQFVDANETIFEPLAANLEELSEKVQASLYYLLGSLVHKIENNFSTCNLCLNSIVTTPDSREIQNLSFFVHLREYKKDLLKLRTLDIYNFILKCEMCFRQNEKKILANILSSKEFIEQFLGQTALPDIPNCHTIVSKLKTLFVKCRIHFSLKNNTNNILNAQLKSSRSVAMRVVLANIQ
jgi:hypothetical protein